MSPRSPGQCEGVVLARGGDPPEPPDLGGKPFPPEPPRPPFGGIPALPAPPVPLASRRWRGLPRSRALLCARPWRPVRRPARAGPRRRGEGAGRTAAIASVELASPPRG